MAVLCDGGGEGISIGPINAFSISADHGGNCEGRAAQPRMLLRRTRGSLREMNTRRKGWWRRRESFCHDPQILEQFRKIDSVNRPESLKNPGPGTKQVQRSGTELSLIA